MRRAGAFGAVAVSAAFVAGALPARAAAPEATYNWGSDTSDYTSTEEFTASKAICRRIGAPKPPAADQPTAAQARALRECNSLKLYYGVGGPPNYARARLCAFVEVGLDIDGPNQLTGAAMLMQVYANGRGVKRDLDLATAFACQVEGAPMESDGRVKHLQSLRARPAVFDFCDDFTSGLAGGVCAWRDAEVAAAPRDRRLKSLVARLPASAQHLYRPMKAAFDAFVEAHDDEVDQSGTARALMTIGEEETLRDQLVKDLSALVQGRWPSASMVRAQQADARLNAAYRTALQRAAGADRYGTVGADDIRKAQRRWLAYRDTFARFAGAASQAVSADAAVTELTRRRTADLEAFSS